MSETQDRRTFLKSGLAALAATALHGCAGEPATVDVPKAEARIQDTLTHALREYLLAQYDAEIASRKSDYLRADKISFWMREEVDRSWANLEKRVAADTIPAKRARFERELAAHGLDTALLTPFDQRQHIPALSAHYANTGLEFHARHNFGNAGYELVRFGKPYTYSAELFGKPATVRVRELEEILVSMSSWYATLNFLPSETVAGAYDPRTKHIELRPEIYRHVAGIRDRFFRAQQMHVEQTLAQPDFLDKFVTTTGVTKEFWIELGTQLRNLSLRPFYADAPTNEKAIARIAPDMVNDILLHETMHATDDADFTFIDQTPYAKDLRHLQQWNAEKRAFLASMAHGNARATLTEMIRYAAYGQRGEPHAIGATKLLEKFTKRMIDHRKEFSNITYAEGTAIGLVKQLPKLTEQQIRTTAKNIFEETYRGRTLKEFVYDFLPDKK